MQPGPTLQAHTCTHTRTHAHTHLWKAENRLLGDSMRGPRGRMVPLSLTHCAVTAVMSAMPMALAEQYRELVAVPGRERVLFSPCAVQLVEKNAVFSF